MWGVPRPGKWFAALHSLPQNDPLSAVESRLAECRKRLGDFRDTQWETVAKPWEGCVAWRAQSVSKAREGKDESWGEYRLNSEVVRGRRCSLRWDAGTTGCPRGRDQVVKEDSPDRGLPQPHPSALYVQQLLSHSLILLSVSELCVFL